MRSLSLPWRSVSLCLCLLAAAPGVHADERSDQLLREVERATKTVPSLAADLQVTLTTQNLAARPVIGQQPRQNDSGFTQGNEPISFTYTGTVKLQRPNLERIELADPIHQTIASDGTSRWTLLPSLEYIKNPADPQGKSQGAYAPILMFFAPETARTAGTVPLAAYSGSENFSTRYLGKERVVLKVARRQQGAGNVGAKETPEEFDVVEVRQLRPTVQAVKLYINADKMVTRVVSETRRGNISTIQDMSLINLKTDPKFDASEFAFVLPPKARPYAIPPVPQRQ